MKCNCITGVVVLLTLSLCQNGLAYEVNEDLLYEEESRFLSSKWTFNFDASGLNSDSNAADSNSQSLTTDIGANTVVEKARTGYWANADFYVDYTRSDNQTAETQTTNIKIKNFTTTSVQGFRNFDWADVGYKFYLSEQSPYYAFTQGLAYWYRTESESTNKNDSTLSTKTDNDGLEATVGVGIGYGKIVDLGSYERVLIVQNKLMAAGLITSKFSRSVVRDLLPLFRETMDDNIRLLNVQSVLTSANLIQAKDMSLDIAKDILDAIDESFEKREYGLELRLGYLQEVKHEDSKEDNDGYVYGYVKYEKPMSKNRQFTSQLNLFYHAVTEEKNKEISAHWLNYVTRQHSKKFTSKYGLEIDYNKVEETTTWEKLFGELDYEITDVLTWENELSYIMTQYEADTLDDKQEYLIKSTLVYTIW